MRIVNNSDPNRELILFQARLDENAAIIRALANMYLAISDCIKFNTSRIFLDNMHLYFC